jgi:predicted nuclease with TOPRIM domain
MAMDDALTRAQERLEQARSGGPAPAELRAAFERARQQMEELAQASAELESSLPEQVGAAVREGLRAEAAPIARQLAELRGLVNQLLRRLSRLEQDFLAERHARVEDLALLVDLISSGWNGVDQRLRRIEARQTGEAAVYRIERRSAT